MKKLAIMIGAVFALLCGTAFADQDLGFLDPGIGIAFHEIGTFTDTASLVQAVDGSASVTVNGGQTWRCAGSNCLYQVSSVSQVTVADSVGNVICQVKDHVQTVIAGGKWRWTWTCSIATLPAGIYTVTIAGRGLSRTKIPNSDRDADEPYSVIAQHQ